MRIANPTIRRPRHHREFPLTAFRAWLDAQKTHPVAAAGFVSAVRRLLAHTGGQLPDEATLRAYDDTLTKPLYTRTRRGWERYTRFAVERNEQLISYPSRAEQYLLSDEFCIGAARLRSLLPPLDRAVERMRDLIWRSTEVDFRGAYSLGWWENRDKDREPNAAALSQPHYTAALQQIASWAPPALRWPVFPLTPNEMRRMGWQRLHEAIRRGEQIVNGVGNPQGHLTRDGVPRPDTRGEDVDDGEDVD